MKLSGRFLFLFIPFFLTTIHLEAIAPIENTSAHHLEEQMKDFRHRVRIYFKCLPGINKCTLAERKAAGKTVLRDGAKLLVGLILLGTGLFVGAKVIYPEWVYQYFKALSPETYEQKKTRFEKLYDKHREALLAIPWDKDQNSPEFNDAMQKANKIEKQLNILKPDLRGSFFYNPED